MLKQTPGIHAFEPPGARAVAHQSLLSVVGWRMGAVRYSF